MKYCALTKIVLATKWLHHVAAIEGGGIRGADEIIDTKEVLSSFIDTKSGASNTWLSEVADSEGVDSIGVVDIIDTKEVLSSFIDTKSGASNTGLPEVADSEGVDSRGVVDIIDTKEVSSSFIDMKSEGGQESATQWIANFGYNEGWRVDRHPRYMSDVNGDGRADIVGFGNDGVRVSLATGTGFTTPYMWIALFGYYQTWRVEKHPRYMADVNGDGLADIVGFGNEGVSVSLSTGWGFIMPYLVTYFGYDDGWRVEKHPRYMADVNGDGLADIVGFGNDGVYVTLATGWGFDLASMWVAGFEYDEGWRVEKHPRYMSDVNGDGLADIVGFGNDGTYVSLSTGSDFTSPSLWVAGFGYDETWRVDKHPRFMADVNGDGLADIVGFHDAGTYVSLSTGSDFTSPFLWIAEFGYTAGIWRVDKHPRYMADVDGDGLADIVGFHDEGTYVSLSTGSKFTSPYLWVADYGYSTFGNGWRVDKHLRYLADVNGDRSPDIVGFGAGGVYVSI